MVKRLTIITANVASRWMREYSIALSPRNASAAMIRMGITGNTYNRIVVTSFSKWMSGCVVQLLWVKGFLPGQPWKGRQSRNSSDVILRVFFNRLWDMARTSKAKEEMRSERAMSPMAILMDMRSWKIEFGTMILLTLFPMDWRKLPKSNKYHLLSKDFALLLIWHGFTWETQWEYGFRNLYM